MRIAVALIMPGQSSGRAGINRHDSGMRVMEAVPAWEIAAEVARSRNAPEL